MSALRAGAAVLGGALALRLWAARRAARARPGDPAGLRTDDGVSLHVEVTGPTDARVTVVLVHGFAARSAMWDRQWAALREHARDLALVVDRCAGPGPVVLVGHSMGGMAVLALAGARPDLFGSRATGVGLLSTLAGPLAVAGTGGRAPLRRALTRAAAWAVWLAAPLAHAVHPFRTGPVQRLLRRRLFADDPPPDAVRRMTDAWIGTPAAVMTAHLPGLARYDRRGTLDPLRGVPVLVLVGTDDATVPPTAAERLARRIGPRARLHLVPGAGHVVPLTHAGTVTSALLDLLARSRAGGDGGRVS
ncbi:Pimeloyl-ACP methyl ester carboxylesterase [Geodermatophilus pulveris]|uniref:Pimeloyl-ACP methyl ester carboxylesterase n=1 Tax=Geodermatophilus pulveris TaxID=1564159 RepID=A0A239CAD6_9ACTN|nr:alpha/beta hydrolase [Geodermatophilus pulveris]SNS16424.1 Pimeloyl-ACP methyl ester carboxylesterase [Geodermatophilus pulveris]